MDNLNAIYAVSLEVMVVSKALAGYIYGVWMTV